MEIPRWVRYTFASQEKRRRMNTRKKIVQEVFTEIAKQSFSKVSNRDIPDTEGMVYRGTLFGWVLFGALLKEPFVISPDPYNQALVTHSHNYANTFPWSTYDLDPDIKRELKRVKIREGLHFRREQKKKIIQALSQRITIHIQDVTDYPTGKSEYNTLIPIQNLARQTQADMQQYLGVNPVALAQRLRDLQ